MKRLTRAKFDVCKDCENLNCLYIEYNRNPAFECLYKIVFDRLAAIEDILGDKYELDRLRELVEADKEGRCVVLPCNVGDKIFCIMDKTINEMTVKGFRREASERWKIVAFTDKNYPHWTEYEMDFNQIGDTICLSYTEAEATLKAREQE